MQQTVICMPDDGHEECDVAVQDTCTHACGSLSEGYIEGDEIQCPLHDGRFNIRTAEATRPPAERNLATCEVGVEGEDILIGIPRYSGPPSLAATLIMPEHLSIG